MSSAGSASRLFAAAQAFSAVGMQHMSRAASTTLSGCIESHVARTSVEELHTLGLVESASYCGMGLHRRRRDIFLLNIGSPKVQDSKPRIAICVGRG